MTIASTAQGKVRENDLHVLKGISFAAPPVNERRWLPRAPFEGERVAWSAIEGAGRL